jgi:hypothetical protein
MLAVRSLCGNVEVYPYEPVAVSIPHQPVHLETGYSAEVTITRTGTPPITEQVSSVHVFGVTNGLSLFLLSALETPVFTNAGVYSVTLENTTSTVTVLTPVVADNAVIPLLDNMTLLKIITNSGRIDLSDDLKITCQQIKALSPNGKYAPYANLYLAIDEFYSFLETIAEEGWAFNAQNVGTTLTALAIPDNLAKWTALYNKGEVYRTLLDLPNTRSTFTTLTNSVQHSIWTRNATMILDALP